LVKGATVSIQPLGAVIALAARRGAEIRDRPAEATSFDDAFLEDRITMWSYSMNIARRMIAAVLVPLAAAAWVAECGAADETVRQGRVSVNGLEMFYREAGDPSQPAIVLLHGFPSSSHMFRDLLPALGLHFHVIAPDYPGMGSSAVPLEGAPALTFDKVADYVEKFLDGMHVDRAIIYMQDFGGPVGMRLATRHPERVAGLKPSSYGATATPYSLQEERTP
jgi:poly(3-hydroxybutyrate) depolymerase